MGTSNRTRISKGGLIAALLLVSISAGAGPAAAGADEKSAALAEKTLEAMGGKEAWEATRFIRFNFAGARTHYWDKHQGRHRLEGKTQEGEPYVVLLDLNTKEGRAWKNGEELQGEAAAEWLENAWGAWINDTYWLVMPYKLFDPGVDLVYKGTEEIDGTTYDKVRMTFEDVGLTPKDTYWVYFNPKTGLVDRWAYHLQDWIAARPSTVWTWSGWQRYGGILLAPERKLVGGDRELPLSDIAVFETLPDSVFESPEPVTATVP
ncbi:MAG: hypothetical protein KDD47_26685 [Acidobacteria bacterium]|nr:hypothetical protein [Acidobacteriota bacterium]